MKRTHEFLGLGFQSLSLAAAVSALLARPRGAKFAYLVTPNADHLTRLARQPWLCNLYQSAFLCVLDSRALWLAATALGIAVPAALTGVDITKALLAALPPQPVTVIGLAPTHLVLLQKRYPHLQFHHHNPPQNLISNPQALVQAQNFATSAQTSFIFIALGSPLQEILAASIAAQPSATGTGLCIGAALEYCSGAIPRAPGWMRHAGLEWLYRLACNPKRLASRYLLRNPPILLALLRQKVRQWQPGPHPQSAAAAISVPGLYPPPRPAPPQKTQDAG